MSKNSIKERAAWLQFRDRWLETQELKCAYCDKRLQSDAPIEPKTIKHHLFARRKDILTSNIATVDHVVPISKGGGRFDINNLAVCCHECNGRKGSKTKEEWLATSGNTYIASRKDTQRKAEEDKMWAERMKELSAMQQLFGSKLEVWKRSEVQLIVLKLG